MTQERTEHAAAQQALRSEKTTFQADLARATAAIAGAKKGTPHPLLGRNVQQLTGAVHLQNPAAILAPAAIAPVAAQNHTYFQFWFDSSLPPPPHSTMKKSIGVRAATTTTPVPYNLASCWPGVDITGTCSNCGSYDSRMDTLITGATIPTTITNRILFANAFPTPPKVVVWLTGFSAATGAAVSVKVTANDITETAFVLQISSGEGARLGSVGVGWAVWPENGWSDWGQKQAAVKVGSVSTLIPGEARLPRLAAVGTLAKGAVGAVFLVAVSAVDLVLTGNLWVDVAMVPGSGGYSDIASTWRMTAGPATARVYSARVVHVSR